ncbi:MAG: hypothetical protein FD138_3231 [Planctomycetota bacterium]|nr:MAG: hypothetical protein FD138_3231 [Planctomycetota bacterium]
MPINLQPYAQLLVCPACRSRLIVDGPSFVCSSDSCRLRYAVKDDIPVMLSDEAQPVAPDAWVAIVQQATANHS